MARQTGWHDALLDVSFVLPTLTDFAKLVAAKAIAELESQEPVAYINVEKRILEWAKLIRWETPTIVNLPKIPLYTRPPQRTEQEPVADDFFKMIADRNPKPFAPSQRTWVGLTDERRKQLINKCWNEYIFGKEDGSYFIEWISVAIEAELKEKNT
jgi:hypothetical protein